MAQTYPIKNSKRMHDAQEQVPSTLNPQRLSQLAWLAILGQAVLFATAWLLPAVSEYRLLSDNISELALGRYGFLLTLAFLLAGSTTLGLAYAIRKLTAGVTGSLTGSLLVGIYGIGAILAAIFPTDRIDTPAQAFTQSTTGMIHMITAMLGFLCIIAAMFVLARTFGKTARMRPLMIWSVIFAGATLSLFLVQGEGPLVGLLQRLMVAAISGWMVMVALRIRSIAVSQLPQAATKLIAR